MSAVTTSIPIPLGERVRIAPTNVHSDIDWKVNDYCLEDWVTLRTAGKNY